MNDDIYTLHRGSAPLLVSLPHDGSHIPQELAERMTERARIAPDTDWHVARLYEIARELGASILRPRYSRYVVDLNRPQDDTSLYPGQNTTGLCPAVQFTGAPVYREGRAPAEDEVAQRVETYWRPYHDALQGELRRLRDAHGGRVRLPDLSIGMSADLEVAVAHGSTCVRIGSAIFGERAAAGSTP